jgi:hypothetical protein
MSLEGFALCGLFFALAFASELSTLAHKKALAFAKAHFVLSGRQDLKPYFISLTFIQIMLFFIHYQTLT